MKTRQPLPFVASRQIDMTTLVRELLTKTAVLWMGAAQPDPAGARIVCQVTTVRRIDARRMGAGV